MLPRLPVIISAAAGAGRPARVEPAIRAALAARYSLAFHYAASLDHLRAAIGEALAAGAPAIAVGGGDGTLHHAVNAIGDASVALAPLPMGTGNDFCRSLGLETLDASLAAIAAGSQRVIDVLEVNGRRVLTVAGLGVVARSALLVTRLTQPGALLRTPLRWCGPHAYLAAGGLHLLLQPRLAGQVRVVLRDHPGSAPRTIEGSFYGAFLAVRPTLGAGMRLPLDVPPDDGRFEVVLVEPAARLTVARNLPRLRRGCALSKGVLTVHQAMEARICWSSGTPLLGDGEDLGSAVDVHARVRPRALAVVADGSTRPSCQTLRSYAG